MDKHEGVHASACADVSNDPVVTSFNLKSETRSVLNYGFIFFLYIIYFITFFVARYQFYYVR